ncbi:hypothetical protein JCM8547_006072 [Rhodosporidiobolus lusitaniae]
MEGAVQPPTPPARSPTAASSTAPPHRPESFALRPPTSSDLSELQPSSDEDKTHSTQPGAAPARPQPSSATVPSPDLNTAQPTPAMDRQPSTSGKKQQKQQDMRGPPAGAPPTPAATASPSLSSSSIPLPSFVSADPLSSDPDSSSDEDPIGRPKPPKPQRFSKSTGLPRPRPSYYYDAEYDPGTGAGTKKKGRRGGYKGVPVFEPTMEDFEGNGGFYGYVKRIEKYGLRSGIVKVVPPKEWSNDLPSVLPPLEEIRLREPIEQLMMGSQGLYRVTNVAKTRIYNAAQWKDMSVLDKYEGPDLKGEREKGDRSERATASATVLERRKKKREERQRMNKGKGRAKEEDVEREEEEGEQADEEAEAEADGEYDDEEDVETPRKGRRTPAKKAASSAKKGKVKKEEEADDGRLEGVEVVDIPVEGLPSASPAASTSTHAGPTPAVDENGDTPMPSSRAPSVTPSLAASSAAAPKKKRLTNLERAQPTAEEWAAFAAKFEELPRGMKKEDYTVEAMRDFERRYWRTLTFGEPPMYGADMAGSLFSDSTKAWNVAHLGDLLPKLAPGACSIPGVVSPYLYFGMWRATFAWHVEDADLYSINYIHFGAPKFWYSVPQEQAQKFERVMEGYFPTDFRKCHEFLRHKAFLASPRVLANSGIVLNRCVQLPGEFILTYPKGYHSGFNLGFNCAESINFATERWLPLGKAAKHCRCIDDSVNIDVNIWLKEAAKAEALAKGEPWPYDEPEPPSSDPTVPSTSGGKKRMALTSGSTPAPKKPKAAPRAQQQPQQQQQYFLAPEARSTLLALLQQHNGILPPQLEYLNPYIPYLYAPAPATRQHQPVPRSTIPQPNPYSAQAFVYGNQNQRAAPKPPRSNSSTFLPKASSSSSSLLGKPSPAPAAAAKPAPPPPPAPKKVAFKCALCPDMAEEGLVKIGEPGAGGGGGGGGRKNGEGLRAHRVCVMFTPATWIEVDPQSEEEMVRGYAKIEKARWKLKCQLCTEPHGTKIQCTKGKCTKAFHVTCALADDSGVLMDATVPDQEHDGEVVSILDAAIALDKMDADGGEGEGKEKGEREKTPEKKVEGEKGKGKSPKSPTKEIPSNEFIQLTVLCRTHNPDWQRLEAERKAAELKAKVDALAPGARIRVKTTGGAFDVTLEAVDYEKETVSFVFDNGKRNSIKWKLIVWPEDPEIARKKQEKLQRSEQAKAAIMDKPKYKNQSAKRHSAVGTMAPPARVAAVGAGAAAPQQAQPNPQAQQPKFYSVAPQQQQHPFQQQQQQQPPQHYGPPQPNHSAVPPPHPQQLYRPPPHPQQQGYPHPAYPTPPQPQYGSPYQQHAGPPQHPQPHPAQQGGYYGAPPPSQQPPQQYYSQHQHYQHAKPLLPPHHQPAPPQHRSPYASPVQAHAQPHLSHSYGPQAGYAPQGGGQPPFSSFAGSVVMQQQQQQGSPPV